MALWFEWFRCVQMLRSACSRQRTFFWMTLALAGLCIRNDLAGVTSLVRVLGLQERSYSCFLNLFHSSGLKQDALERCWTQAVLKLFTPFRLDGRLMFIADGLKVAKEGLKMPAVKKLHQSSANNSKPSYIFGHSFQALGLLVSGPLGHLCCVPLCSPIHEGVVFSNRDKRTLLDKLAMMFLGVMGGIDAPGAILVADAYYASGKIIKPLLKRGYHLISRLRTNAVAYYLPDVPAKRGRGRPPTYGRKVRLSILWNIACEHFCDAPSPVYGETNITLRYYTIELLWRPVGQLVRFVLVEHPVRGRIMLMSTDRTLSALQIIAGYGYRFKIEVAFKQALYTLGTYAYHFWMLVMSPRPNRSGNQYLHRKSADYRDRVRRKLAAYHRHVQLGCIAQGLLQYLALHFRQSVWSHFKSWLRTMKPAQPPSEAVVAQALRDALPEFLLGTPDEHNLKKFLLEHIDFDRSPHLRLMI